MCVCVCVCIKIIIECLTQFLEKLIFNRTNFRDLQVPSSGTTVMNKHEYK